MPVLPRLTIVSALLLAPAVALAQAGPPPGVTWQSQAPGAHTVVHRGGGQHHGVDVRHHRLQRGHVVPPFWFGPQFHIANWSLYDFPDPGAQQRWVRYYDDAYLIDRGGRVADARYGLDWDQYGERWDDRDGIPAYHGRNEWHPGDVDYAWARENGAWEHGPGPQGYAYGQGAPYGGQGYGYGYAYPIIIETTVTRPIQTYTTEIIEEVVEVRQRPRRRAVRRAAAPAPRPACNCPAPAARPAPPPPPAAAPPPPVPAGERG